MTVFLSMFEKDAIRIKSMQQSDYNYCSDNIIQVKDELFWLKII
jgi:hypothetical protein